MDRLIEQGCLDIWIDGIVPCLKDTETGELKETVTVQSPLNSSKFFVLSSKPFVTSGANHIV